MASQTKITLTHDKETTGDLQSDLITATWSANSHINSLENLLNKVAGVDANATLTTVIDDGNAAKASGTLTLAAVVATDTCVINGVTFTCVASGATGNQFNVGGTDTVTATNLAAVINASASTGISGLVSATSAAAVVTVTAVAAGVTGNGYTLTGNSHITASGAQLTGGTAATNSKSVTYGFGL